MHWDKLFTFIEQEGVDPTNNVSERALRLFVLIRKITYGNRSAKGEIALARLLTVTQTCKLQQRASQLLSDCGSLPPAAPASAQPAPSPKSTSIGA